MESEYIGVNDKIFVNSGKYRWNKDNTEIILSGLTNRPNKFIVGNNCIIQLDMNGSRISGELAQKYILKKMK